MITTFKPSVENNDVKENYDNVDIYSKVVRAGRRTYFFDVKATRGNDYFLTITESRKKEGKDGESFYERHKIHLYKEDFYKYLEGLQDAISYIKSEKTEWTQRPHETLEIKPSPAMSLSLDEEFEML